LGPGIPLGLPWRANTARGTDLCGAGHYGRRRSRDFAIAIRRPTWLHPARSPASGLARSNSPAKAGDSSCATSSIDFCNTTTMRGHLHATASIPRACCWSFPGHVASSPFPVCPKRRAVNVFVLPKSPLAESHRVEVAFPSGTPEPLLHESRTPRRHHFARAMLWRSSSRFEMVEVHPPASFREERPP
jgi:hypothetical protein